MPEFTQADGSMFFNNRHTRIVEALRKIFGEWDSHPSDAQFEEYAGEIESVLEPKVFPPSAE